MKLSSHRGRVAACLLFPPLLALGIFSLLDDEWKCAADEASLWIVAGTVLLALFFIAFYLGRMT